MLIQASIISFILIVTIIVLTIALFYKKNRLKNKLGGNEIKNIRPPKVIPPNNSFIENPIAISLGIDCDSIIVSGYDYFNDLNQHNSEDKLPFDSCVTYRGVTNIIRDRYRTISLIKKEGMPDGVNNGLDLYNGILFVHEHKHGDINLTYSIRWKRFHALLKAYETSLNSQQIVFIRKGHTPSQHNEDFIVKYNGKFKDDVEDMNQLIIYLAKAYPRLNYKIILTPMCDCKPVKNLDKPHLKIFNCSMMPNKLYDILRLNVLNPLKQGIKIPKTNEWEKNIINNYISNIPNGKNLLCGH